jgi:hypothetical protein
MTINVPELVEITRSRFNAIAYSLSIDQATSLLGEPLQQLGVKKRSEAVAVGLRLGLLT